MKKCIYTTLLPLLFILFLNAQTLSAQNGRISWGNVSQKEHAMTQCAYDTSASAVILQSIGKLTFLPGEPVQMRKYIKIKILSKEGLDWANARIPFYYRENIEKVKNIVGQTINMSSNGQVKITTLKPDQIFTKKVNRYYKVETFTLPNVKVGSIIEYQYDLYTYAPTNLDDWIFQDKIPTLYSSLESKFSGKFRYHVVLRGERIEKKYPPAKGMTNIWALENLPAMRKEPFVNNHWKYAERLKFYAESFMPRSVLVKRILDQDAFSPYAQRRFGSARKILKKLSLQGLNTKQKIELIYNKVRDHFIWNERYGRYPNQSLRTAWKTQQANGAGINLWLATLLKNAKFEAFPILISTQANGKIWQAFPFSSQFNHLIVAVKIDQKYIFMDAKNKNLPCGLLPIEDLNEVGFILNPDFAKFIPLKSSQPTQTRVFATLDVAKGTASVNVNLQGQQAYQARKHLTKSNAKKAFDNKLSLNNEELPLDKASAKNLDHLSKPVQLTAEYHMEEAPDLANILYIKPILWNEYKDNPFKAPQRLYPIEFNYPFEDIYQLNLTIPKGYQVESVPKNVNTKTKDGSIRFLYQTRVFGNQLQVLGKIQFRKSKIPQKNYGAVRELYSQIVEKYQEMIVLKKISKK